MRHQAVRTMAVMLGVLFAAAPAARAGSITYGDLVRTIGAHGQLRPGSEVRLRFGAQGVGVQAQGGSAQSGAVSSQGQQTTQGGPVSTTTTSPASADLTVSQSGGRVETVDLGDVTGTVCDCGEVPAPPIPKAGFPWWPLLGGAVVPFLFPRGENPPEDTPGPTPTPPQVPEPMSLLLFGSGLLAAGAGARRRHGRRRLEAEALSAKAEEV